MRVLDSFGKVFCRLVIFGLVIGVSTQFAAADLVVWEGGTGNFGDSNWTVDGVMGQAHPGFPSGDHDTVISSGLVNFTTTTAPQSGFFLRNGDTATLNGGSISGNFLALDAGGTVFTLESGTVTLSDSNGIRSVSNGFNGQLDWTGAAGAGSIVQTNNTNNGSSLAGKISVAAPLFAIDGTLVSSSVVYDGTNLAAVNADLATSVVNGRFFQIAEAGGTQTLSLSAVAVPEPTSLGIFAVAGLGLLFRRRRA